MCMIAVSEGCQYWGFDLSLNPALFIKSGIDHRLDLFFAIFFSSLGLFSGTQTMQLSSSVLTLAEVVH